MTEVHENTRSRSDPAAQAQQIDHRGARSVLADHLHGLSIGRAEWPHHVGREPGTG